MLRRRATIVVTLLAIAPRASAQAPEPRTTAVVRVGSPLDEELLERVRGQTIDLAVDLEVERVDSGGGAEPLLDEQLAAARALAARHDARIVVWFRADPDGEHTTVFIAEPAADRVLVRRIDHGDGGPVLARSAAFEAAALVVRSSVKALAAGGRIGVETRAVTRPPPPLPEPEPPPPATTASPVFAIAALGWSGALTDPELRGHNAVAGRIGLGRGAVRVAIDGTLGAEVAYRDDRTVVHLARHRLGLEAEYARPLGARTVVGVAAAAGAAWYQRATDALDPGVMATPASRTLVPIAGVALRLRYRPSRAPIALEVSAGAEGSLQVPHFGYELDGAFVERTTMWPVAPRLGVALFVESGQ